MALKAFTSRRVVLPKTIGDFAVLVDGEKIAGVVPRERNPGYCRLLRTSAIWQFFRDWLIRISI